MPPVTCDYNFYIASDDQGQLNLSNDTDPANKVTIARVDGYTSSRDWFKYTTQKSAPVHLEKGQRVYMEALHKDGGGGDNLAIAWECSQHGIALEVIDASYTSVLPVLTTPMPSPSPSTTPSASPSKAPSKAPKNSPSKAPTSQPTDIPTDQPTKSPINPTNNPTPGPTTSPINPTNNPTVSPSKAPTPSPINPTNNPTLDPTLNPTLPPVLTSQPTSCGRRFELAHSGCTTGIDPLCCSGTCWKNGGYKKLCK